MVESRRNAALAEWLAGWGMGAVDPLRSRSDALLFTDDRLVLKVHRPGTSPVELTQRLAAAAASEELLSPIELQPISLPRPIVQLLQSGSLGSLWPRVETLSPETPAVELPWGEGGLLLSRLHTRAAPQVPAGGIGRALRALAWLECSRGESAEPVLAAAATLPAPELTFAGGTLIHGDYHFGQLGRPAGVAQWRLLDVDEVGTGAPLSDLGRIAALFAVGAIGPAQWQDFVAGYRAGPSGLLGAAGPIWHLVDPHARWAVVIAAAGLLRRPPDEANAGQLLTEFLKACHRIAST